MHSAQLLFLSACKCEPICSDQHSRLAQLIKLVEYLLHDNPPNTTVLSYYLSTVGLLFGFAVSTTSYFLYAQQTDLYAAVYEEASSLNTLLEECACSLSPQDAGVVAAEVARYLADGVWAHENGLLPAEGSSLASEIFVQHSREPRHAPALASEILCSEDAINRIARHIMLVSPVSPRINLSEAVRGVRMTSTKRLAAGQVCQHVFELTPRPVNASLTPAPHGSRQRCRNCSSQ